MQQFPCNLALKNGVWYGSGFCKTEASARQEQGKLVGQTLMYDVVLSPVLALLIVRCRTGPRASMLM